MSANAGETKSRHATETKPMPRIVVYFVLAHIAFASSVFVATHAGSGESGPTATAPAALTSG